MLVKDVHKVFTWCVEVMKIIAVTFKLKAEENSLILILIFMMYNVIYTLYVFMHILEIQCTTCSMYIQISWMRSVEMK